MVTGSRLPRLPHCQLVVSVFIMEPAFALNMVVFCLHLDPFHTMQFLVALMELPDSECLRLLVYGKVVKKKRSKAILHVTWKRRFGDFEGEKGRELTGESTFLKMFYKTYPVMLQLRQVIRKWKEKVSASACVLTLTIL